MIIKLSLKSHFKFFRELRHGKNVQKKKIVVTELCIFIMALSCFLNKEFFETSLIFTKKKFFKINLLKSPVRHKKFFNQIFSEIFCVRLCIFYKTTSCIDYAELTTMFLLFKSQLDVLGTNLLTRTKISICFLHAFSIIDELRGESKDSQVLVIKNNYPIY